jgi:hypothetical protein
MIKTHRNVQMIRQAQITPFMPKNIKTQNKSINKRGVGGGFRNPWSERSLSKTNLLRNV